MKANRFNAALFISFVIKTISEKNESITLNTWAHITIVVIVGVGHCIILPNPFIELL